MSVGSEVPPGAGHVAVLVVAAGAVVHPLTGAVDADPLGEALALPLADAEADASADAETDGDAAGAEFPREDRTITATAPSTTTRPATTAITRLRCLRSASRSIRRCC